jgi:L-iditol 2-dehydrogenase
VQAVQLVREGTFEVIEVPVPTPDSGEVLVQMESASVCGSDLRTIFGGHVVAFPLAPGRPGHEGVGMVIESRSANWAVGDRVLTVPMPGAGACFAEFQVVDERFLVALQSDASPQEIVMAQPLGTVINGFRRYWPVGLSGDGLTAAILGAGTAGLFALQLAKLAGFSRVIVGDLEPDRLEVATKLGADVTVQVPERSFVEAVRDHTDGAGAELVIEAAGFDTCRAECISATRYLGRTGFFGLPEHAGAVEFPLAEAFARGSTIVMAGNAQLEEGLTSFHEAIGLIESGALNVAHLLDSSYALGEVQEAMDVAHERRALKVSFDLSG